MTINASITQWPPESICFAREALSKLPNLGTEIYQRVCRTDFESPGFCAVNLGSDIDSIECRRLMVALKQELTTIQRERTGDTLQYLSAARFDQQESTKPHLDGGPDECFLMLGYEPTGVAAEIELFDYSRCAFDLGLTPSEFLAQYNPMFQSGYEKLIPYSCGLPCFSKGDFQIVCINNSSAPFLPDNTSWQGVLHSAKILTPDASKRRVVNSTMIARTPTETRNAISDADLQTFMTTATVRRRGYDKPGLDE